MSHLINVQCLPRSLSLAFTVSLGEKMTLQGCLVSEALGGGGWKGQRLLAPKPSSSHVWGWGPGLLSVSCS